MATVIHIAEVAAIIAVAYALGWAIGYFAHRVVASRPRRIEMPAEIAAAVAAATDADALVKAPVIVPVSDEPPPVHPQTPAVPSVEPAPAPQEAVTAQSPTSSAEPPAVQPAAQEFRMEPVVPLIRTTLPPMEIPPMDLGALAVPMPKRSEPLARMPKPAPLPELEPLPEPEPTVPFTATPALRPGEAWSGEIRGRAAIAPAKPVDEKAAEVFEQPPIEVPVTLELTETITFISEPEPVVIEEPVEPESIPLEAPPVADDVAPIAPPPVAPPTSVPSPAPPSEAPHDEDAAMRAIEGGWSRVKTRALPNSPELSDVGAAVAAAQTAVEQVLAQAGIDPESSQRASKPAGLTGPRASRRDDLKQINGLGALDESTLNNLGVYHFDQIAGWDEAQVLWMENHVFARGRIGRENWQQQARDLAAAVAG